MEILIIATIAVWYIKRKLARARCRRVGHKWRTRRNNTLKCYRCGAKSLHQAIIRPQRKYEDF